jgi:hypothetical protein
LYYLDLITFDEFISHKVFGDQELKGHGEAILEGRTSHEQEVQERRRQD